MAIRKTTTSEAARNVRVRRSSDRLLARLQNVHGQASEIRAPRKHKPAEHHDHDNGASDRNSAAPVDLHLIQAVALLDG